MPLVSSASASAASPSDGNAPPHAHRPHAPRAQSAHPRAAPHRRSNNRGDIHSRHTTLPQRRNDDSVQYPIPGQSANDKPRPPTCKLCPLPGSAMNLPQPSDEALAQSDALDRAPAYVHHRAGGWISFADYMPSALHPGLGYYSGGAHKFGPTGDHYLSGGTPLFGQAFGAVSGQKSPRSLAPRPRSGRGPASRRRPAPGPRPARLYLSTIRFSKSPVRLRGRQADTLRMSALPRWPAGCAGSTPSRTLLGRGGGQRGARCDAGACAGLARRRPYSSAA